jgi:hypothetical protein
MLATRISDIAGPALRLVAARELRSFEGLSSSTSLDDVAAVFDLDRSWRGEGVLGSAKHRTRWLSAAAPGFGWGVRVWADDDAVVLLDATDLTLAEELASLLGALGEPEAKLDSYQGTLEIAGNEYVYPRRGLTLYVNPDHDALLRFAVFSPTSLALYRQNLRLDLRMKRLPPSRHRAEDDLP